MYKKTKLSLLISSALLAQSAFSMQAIAAEEAEVATQETAVEVEESASDIERITVTTRNITETLETIPLSISAMSNREIEEKGIQSSEDVAKYINGLTFDIGAGPNDTRPTIRGLTIDRGRPNVAILVDGIDVSSETMTLSGGGMTANMKLLDLQQVEVVKGPQSVNYGRSAFAGAINYVTKRPSFEKQVKLDANIAENSTHDLALTIEGALTESFAAKIKVIDSSSDGEYDNPNTGGNLGYSESQGVALSALYLPRDDMSIYFRAETSDEEYGPRPVVAIRSMLPEFDPMTNPFATGSVNTAQGGKMLPYSFDAPQDCAAAEAGPYWDSWAFLGPQPNCRPMVTGPIEGNESQIDLSADPRTGKDYRGTDVENSRVSFEFEWDLEDVNFVSSTSYTKSDTSVIEDFDGTDYSLYSDPVGMPQFGAPAWSQFGMQSDSSSTYELEQYNQEFRLSGDTDKFNWVASALFWKEEMETGFGNQFWLREGADKATVLAQLQQSPFTSFISDLKEGPFADGVNKITPMTRDTEHWSVAGLINWHVTDDLNISFEGRYIDETIDYTGDADDRSYDAFYMFGMHAYEFGQLSFDPTIPPFGGFVPNENYKTENSVSDSAFLPRVTVDYQVNETVFTYATVSKGFKPGGITTTDANGDVRDGEYKPEELWAYEIGAKAFSVENNVSVNVAAFYWEYTDQQTPFTFFNDAGIANVSVINAGESEVKGFEIDSVWVPIPELRISGAYLYSDSSYTDFNLAEIIAGADLPGAEVSDVDKMIAGNADGDFSGKQLPLSAKHTGTINARYTTEVFELKAFVEMFGQYSSKRYVDRGEHSYLDSYWEWDLSIGMQGDNWTVTGYVDNVFDDDTIKSAVGNVDYGFFPDGQAVPFTVNATLPSLRTAGVRMSYTF